MRVATKYFFRGIAALAICAAWSMVAVGQGKYFVQFANKAHSPYSLDKPLDFLSQKSIERRLRQGIALNEADLPVSPKYVKSISDAGARVLYTLKWFNGVVAEIPTPEAHSQIQGQAWVTSILPIYVPSSKQGAMPELDTDPLFPRTKAGADDYYDYGGANDQVLMLKGNKLHNQGFRGQGMTIAVLDAGFMRVDSLRAFNTLRTNGRITGEYDFVNPLSNIYDEHGHGMIVLSVMAGHLPGELVGTAPEAEYILIRTENAHSEQVVEEYNWAAGAELADSLGADIINSSLGYFIYDVPEQSHTYADLDGVTTIVARAANQAARVGMLVVTSAGNEGNSSWKHIISPADGLYCLAVGAVDRQAQYVSFSSIGPSPDGRVKPEVVAMGNEVAIQALDGTVGSASGTSLSAPIVSGLAACLWQAFPHLSVAELRSRIILSSNGLSDSRLGHGIPNFYRALTGEGIPPQTNIKSLWLYPNPATNHVSVLLPPVFTNSSTLTLYNLGGSMVFGDRISTYSPIHEFAIPSGTPSGCYLVTVTHGGLMLSGKLMVKTLP